MKPLRKSWFYFNYSEKQLTWIFIILCILAASYVKILQFSPFSEQELTQEQLDKFEKWIFQQKSVKQEKQVHSKTKTYHITSRFDPNTISKEELIASGLKPGIAERIVKYRTYYPIQSPHQMYTIYGIDSQWVEKAMDYMTFTKGSYEKPNKQNHGNYTIKNVQNSYSKKSETHYETKETQVVYLNTATEQQLQSLRGIGPTRSKRIIQYRNKLGGFTHINQLTEVYGIDSVWVQQNQKKIEITGPVSKRIPINTDSFKLLIQHPYIDYKTAQLIYNYRKQHGNYMQLEDLYKNYGLDSALILKVKPYIFFE